MPAIARRVKSALAQLISSAADPSTVSTAAQLYCKTTSGTVQLYAMNGAGTVFPLTPSAPSFSVTAVKTSTYSAATGELVRCDPSGGGFTVNLPTAVGNTGLSIMIKNVTSSSNTITIDANGTQTIDGSLTVLIERGLAALWLISDGANWMIV